MKKIFFVFSFLLLLAGLFVNCSSDDDEGNGEPTTDNTETKSDYTATNKVKTVTIKSYDVQERNDITIYEDFNRKYSLTYCIGYLYLFPYERISGVWSCRIDRNYYGYPISNEIKSYNIAIQDMGKMNGISAIVGKNIKSEHNGVGRAIYPNLQPYHGYAMSFKTEDDEVKYLRVYFSKYTTDEYGQISSITIQYQLY